MSAVQFLPLAVSPLIGGFIASAVSLRATFVAGAILCLASLIIVLWLLNPDSSRVQVGSNGSKQTSTGGILHAMRTPRFIGGAVVLFTVQFGEFSWFPVLPLRLGDFISTQADVQKTTGLFYAIGAIAYGIGTWSIGRLGATKHCSLMAVVLGAAASFLLAAVAENSGTLAAARVLVALLGGAALTLGYDLVIREFSSKESQAAFGVLWGSALLGRAVSPFATGTAAQAGLAAPFFVDAFLYLVCFGTVVGVVASKPARVEAPQARSD
jgi:MFS family permease